MCITKISIITIFLYDHSILLWLQHSSMITVFFYDHSILPWLQYFSMITVFFCDYNILPWLQYSSMITVFFHDYNIFPWSQYFFMITIFFYDHNPFDYHNLYENKQAYKFHHLKQIFYRQSMIIIFCQFHRFLFCCDIYSFNSIWFFTINFNYRVHLWF